MLSQNLCLRSARRLESAPPRGGPRCPLNSGSPAGWGRGARSARTSAPGPRWRSCLAPSTTTQKRNSRSVTPAGERSSPPRTAGTKSRAAGLPAAWGDRFDTASAPLERVVRRPARHSEPFCRLGEAALGDRSGDFGGLGADAGVEVLAAFVLPPSLPSSAAHLAQPQLLDRRIRAAAHSPDAIRIQLRPPLGAKYRGGVSAANARRTVLRCSPV